MTGNQDGNPVRVEILGLDGRTVLKTTLSGNAKHVISMDDQAAGLYILKVNSGGNLGIAKIIRE